MLLAELAAPRTPLSWLLNTQSFWRQSPLQCMLSIACTCAGAPDVRLLCNVAPLLWAVTSLAADKEACTVDFQLRPGYTLSEMLPECCLHQLFAEHFSCVCRCARQSRPV